MMSLSDLLSQGTQQQPVDYESQPIGDTRTLSGRIQEMLGATQAKKNQGVQDILAARFKPETSDYGSAAVQTLIGDNVVSGQDVASQRGLGQIESLSKLAKLQTGGDLPSDIQNYNFFSKLTPEQQQQFLTVKRAQQVMNLGGNMVVRNPLGGIAESYPVTPKPEQMPGFKATVAEAESNARNAAERNQNRPAENAKMALAQQGFKNVNASIDQALGQIDKSLTSGYGGYLTQNIAGTPSFNLKKTLGTVKANLGFKELQAMREASPTGGALGQVAVQELDALQSTIANLDIGQDDETIAAGLKKIQDHLSRLNQIQKNVYKEKYGEDFSTGEPQTFGADNPIPPAMPAANQPYTNDLNVGGIPDMVMKEAQRAPDGKLYIPDPTRPNKWLLLEE